MAGLRLFIWPRALPHRPSSRTSPGWVVAPRFAAPRAGGGHGRVRSRERCKPGGQRREKVARQKREQEFVCRFGSVCLPTEVSVDDDDVITLAHEKKKLKSIRT